MIWKVKSGQTIDEPVTVEELKLHLRVDNTLEDTLITGLGVTARQYIEKLTDQILVTSTVLGYFDRFPLLEDCLTLPIFPIQSIATIKYIDSEATDTSLTTWEATKYRTDLVSRYARIAPRSSESFPTVADELNAIEIEFVAGFEAVAKVPKRFKTAIKLLVGEMYEHRQNRIHNLPDTVVNLLRFDMDFTIA